MTLRLVDGGIPAFEWKMKRFEIPYTEEEMIELKNKIEEGLLDEKKASKKRYEMKNDTKSSFELYRKILQKLPGAPGNLVLAATTANLMTIIEVFKSDLDLREEFKNSTKKIDGIELDRYQWLKKLTYENGIDSIRFLIGRSY